MEDWGGGLWGCTVNDDECGICIAACICPAVVYGINYSIITKRKDDDSHSGCILPCIAHALVDSLLSTIALGACWGGPCANGGCSGVLLPLACCLRYNHRRAAVWLHDDTESKAMSLLYEMACWGCSIAQVNRQFRKRVEAPANKQLKGNNLTGWLTKNTMSSVLK